MAYKYLNDDGLKAYTKKVKGTLKDLHSPIAISSENTTESMAQNAKNIADYIEKAKAAGIADVNGMAVTCLIDNDYSGVGYTYDFGGDISVQGVLIKDDLVDNMCFSVYSDGNYLRKGLIVSGNEIAEVTFDRLAKGARRPIILTPDTTEVDEETYQKLLSDDVDVMSITGDGNLCALTYKSVDNTSLNLVFTGLSLEGETEDDLWFYGFGVVITKDSPHNCTINSGYYDTLSNFLGLSSFIKKSSLFPVLQEIDLTGTDEERKAKLDQFEADWKALTGASDLMGARFLGHLQNIGGNTNSSDYFGVFTYDNANAGYSSVCSNINSEMPALLTIDKETGAIYITPLFSHLEAITIQPGNGDANVAAIKAYIDNLKGLGFASEKGCIIPVIYIEEQHEYYGSLFYKKDTSRLRGIVSIGARYYNLSVDKNDGSISFDMEDPVIFDSGLSPIRASIEFLATCVKFTEISSSNKSKLDDYLRDVPNATVMHCTYKDVYAGTLYKINSDWYGLLVKNTNNPADNVNIKLSADGTIITSNSAQ